MNLLMLSGDSSVAQGQAGAFSAMLQRFSAYWDRVDVICPRAPNASPRALYDRVHIHPSPWHKVLQPWYIVRQGRALFKEREYALVVSHDFGLFYNGWGAWLLTRGTPVPYVSEILHVEGYPHAVTMRERLYRRVARRYIQWVWKHAAAVRVINSIEMPHFMQHLGVPPEKILMLPALYIDFDIFRPLLGVPLQYDVLFVGRLVPNKGLFTILDAIAAVRDTHPKVQLGIRGQGPLRNRLEARIAALSLQDNVTFIQHQESFADLARLYNAARMVVCASTAEGGPRVTVEAMACGTPVISTPVGVMPEVVRDGTTGLLFRWSAVELAEKINLLLDHEPLRVQLGKNGCEAVQIFEAGRVIEQYARGYHNLIDRLRAAPCAS